MSSGPRAIKSSFSCVGDQMLSNLAINFPWQRQIFPDVMAHTHCMGQGTGQGQGPGWTQQKTMVTCPCPCPCVVCTVHSVI